MSGEKTQGSVSAELREVLMMIPVLARRLLLDTPCVEATVPMLRGTWGAALHELDPDGYRRVFTGDDAEAGVPGYVLRPAPPDPDEFPAIEWILLGEAVSDDPTLLRAWDIASGMGLGKHRDRFVVRGEA